MSTPTNWTHTAGYRLDAAEKTMTYSHESKPLLATVTVELTDSPDILPNRAYRISILQTSEDGSKSTATPLTTETFEEKEAAQEKLWYVMGTQT